METLRKIKKRTENAFGKKVYLLGIDKDGYGVWLQEPSWDCEWYWGFGYIERYTNKMHPELARDIDSHTHWDSGIVGEHEYYDTESQTWKKTEYNHHLNDNTTLKATTLTDNESWKLAELMKTYYSLRESASVFGKGGSNVSSSEIEQDIVKRVKWATEINEVILPKLFKEIDKLLTPQ